jgi:hypothetical protein
VAALTGCHPLALLDDAQSGPYVSMSSGRPLPQPPGGHVRIQKPLYGRCIHQSTGDHLLETRLCTIPCVESLRTASREICSACSSAKKDLSLLLCCTLTYCCPPSPIHPSLFDLTRVSEPNRRYPNVMNKSLYLSGTVLAGTPATKPSWSN